VGVLALNYSGIQTVENMKKGFFFLQAYWAGGGSAMKFLIL
jgi:hypothetical protein